MRSHRWSVTTEPTWEPVTLAEAKDFCRIDHSDEDAVVETLITAARQTLERMLGRAIPQQTITAYYSCFWDTFELPRAAPLVSVTSLKYLDVDGVEQTASSSLYDVYTVPEPGEVRLAYDATWPTHRVTTDPVYIAYVCGWAGAGDIPATIKQGILLLVGHWYENRESTTGFPVQETPQTLETVIGGYRVRWL